LKIIRHVRRTAWCAATLGVTLAPLAYVGAGWKDLRDAFLEIAAAYFPLLLGTNSGRLSASEAPQTLIPRSRMIIAVALVVFAIFVATLGRGLSIDPLRTFHSLNR
jgi:hypothetical protein